MFKVLSDWYDRHPITINLFMAIVWLFISIDLLYTSIDRASIKEELERVNANLQQAVTDVEPMQHQISYLKSDKKELYKALASCNFLRETENLPIGEINKDLVKALSSYYNAESQVTKALEKYKEE